MRLTYVGHATSRIDVDNAIVLTDPVLRDRVAFLRSTPQVRRQADGRPVLVVLSHMHLDHCDLRSLRSLGRAATLVVPPDRASFFTRREFSRVLALRPGESVCVDGVSVTATEAMHDGRRWPIGRHRPAVGFVIAAGGVRVYFAGDTDLYDGMAGLDAPHIALLPVWGWGRSIGPGHLDPFRAAVAVELIRPQIAVPIHWGTLRPMWRRCPSLDDESSPPRRFERHVHGRGSPTRVVALGPGQFFDWPPSCPDTPDRGLFARGG